MEDNVYNVNRIKSVKIEDNETYQKYSQTIVKDVPIDDMRLLMKMFFDKAAVNMGKESYDAPAVAIESILEFLYKDFNYVPVYQIGSSIIQGSLGKFGAGRLVPNTVYRWFNDAGAEYRRLLVHKKIEDDLAYKFIPFDLDTFPLGRAINRKIEWYRKGLLSMDDWDKVPLKELAEREGKGLHSVPELFGIKSNKT
jgi:hypothetical protein